MLRAATDQGLEDLVKCIDSFQQTSVECPEEQPQVFLLPDQLPWDSKPRPQLGAAALTSGQIEINDLSLNEPGVIEHNQQEDRPAHAMDWQNQRSLLGGPVPQDSANVDQSSLHTHGSVSLIGSTHENGTVSNNMPTNVQLPHEISSEPPGVGEGVLPSESSEALNQFHDDDDDDDEGDEEAGGVVTVLHVDDPRLAFGQSVYVGRRDGSGEVPRAQSPRPLAATKVGVVNVQGQSTESKPTKPMFGQPLTGVDIPPVGSHSASVVQPGSLSEGQLNDPDIMPGRAPPLLPPSAFTSSTLGMPPEPRAVPPLNSQQPPATQSLPTSVPGEHNAQSWENDFTSGGSYNPAMSSLGFSASVPPLRARATDLEGGSANSDPTSGLPDVSVN